MKSCHMCAILHKTPHEGGEGDVNEYKAFTVGVDDIYGVVSVLRTICK